MFDKLKQVRFYLSQWLAGLRPGANRVLLQRMLDTVTEMKRENQILLGHLGLPPAEVWKDRPVVIPGEAAASAFPNSTLCRQESFEAPYFSYWSVRLGHVLRYHRKLWEFVFICQALHERGFIKPGFRGLGFGVGEEPMPAYFASQGCKVLGTDLDPAEALARGWTATAQHARGKAAMYIDWMCPQDLFEANVDFRNADMNAIPPDLQGFDFCWSACALEHLGSIEKGLAFIEASVETLRPGGVAVHTTEFNLSSNDGTIDNDGTVLFRRRDLEELGRRLAANGHSLAPLDLDPGLGPVDRYIDVPPYRVQPHLAMLLGGYATTSVGVIVQRGA